jgi:hypothetical protein
MSLAVPAHARSHNVRGILAMLASTAVFVLSLLKIATGALPTGEAIFLRGVSPLLHRPVHPPRLSALQHVVSARNAAAPSPRCGSRAFFLGALCACRSAMPPPLPVPRRGDHRRRRAVLREASAGDAGCGVGPSAC